jgi:hypothetical protein
MAALSRRLTAPGSERSCGNPFAPDSPLEGDGFEPLVPRRKTRFWPVSQKKRRAVARRQGWGLAHRGTEEPSQLPFHESVETNIPAASYCGMACPAGICKTLTIFHDGTHESYEHRWRLSRRIPFDAKAPQITARPCNRAHHGGACRCHQKSSCVPLSSKYATSIALEAPARLSCWGLIGPTTRHQ